MKSLTLTDPETKYAIPPEGCEPYLTPGRKYEIIDKVEGRNINSFTIKSGEEKHFCLEKECLHINGKDWIFSS